MTRNGSPSVRDFRGWYYLRKWRETISFAQMKQDHDGSAAARLGAILPLERPIFVIGSPRSGTTFLGSVLSGLPDSTYFYEPPIFKYRSRAVYEGQLPAWRIKALYELGFRALLLAAPGSGRRVIEKNPNHTWVAEELLRAFPDAHFVSLVRDGRDVAVSLAEKPWHLASSQGSGRREPGGYLNGRYPHFYIEETRRPEYWRTSDIHRCAWIWRRHTEEIERLRDVLPADTFTEVRYEELLEDPEPTLRALLDRLGENRDGALAGVLDIAAGGHTNSIGRWRETLSDDQRTLVAAECGALLDRFGYT